MFKTVRMPFFSAEDNGGGDDNHQESGKVTFSPEQQAEMDRIIGQRITSVKASYAGFEDMKDIADTLESFGYTGTVSEKKAAFKARAEEVKKAKELEDLEEEAAEKGSSPELLAEIKALKKDLAEIKSEKEQQKQQEQDAKNAEDAFQAQVKEFSEAHEDVDVAKLYENKKFMEFVADSRPGLTLLQVYNKYIDLVGSAEKAAIEKMKANNDRSTSSGKAKGDPSGATHGLTENQQRLAKQNDISFKDYAESLKDIQ